MRSASLDVLVLGGEGMLRHKMFRVFLSRYPDTACTIRGALADPFHARVGLFRQWKVIEKVDTMDLPDVVPDYDVDNVSGKVVRIILSYTGYVNRTVWHRQ